jgi:hypothetical protein
VSVAMQATLSVEFDVTKRRPVCVQTVPQTAMAALGYLPATNASNAMWATHSTSLARNVSELLLGVNVRMVPLALARAQQKICTIVTSAPLASSSPSTAPDVKARASALVAMQIRLAAQRQSRQNVHDVCPGLSLAARQTHAQRRRSNASVSMESQTPTVVVTARCTSVRSATLDTP